MSARKIITPRVPIGNHSNISNLSKVGVVELFERLQLIDFILLMY